jgi:hypothetical protein
MHSWCTVRAYIHFTPALNKSRMIMLEMHAGCAGLVLHLSGYMLVHHRERREWGRLVILYWRVYAERIELIVLVVR